MSLSSAINTAQQMLSNTAKQTSVISQNVANAGNASYGRRDAVLTTSLGGSRIVGIDRAQDAALLAQVLSAGSSSSAQEALLAGLNKLNAAMGGNDFASAPSTLIAKLRDALQTYATKPNDITAAQAAVAAAADVANNLNAASETVTQVRSSADADIATGVDALNGLLAQFETVNNAVVEGTRTGKDVSDALDQRDNLLKSISSYVGIDTVTRPGNDMVIYTDAGTTLFETVPRTVSFTPTPTFSAGSSGNSVFIDGVPLAAGEGANTTATGSLQGLLQLRDSVAPQFQSQLDEIARSLVQAFSEKDQSDPPTLPDMPGLFTWSGGTVPAPGTLVNGIAGTLSVSTAVDPEQEGDPTLLRDGGINGAAYVANDGQGTGYSALLDAYVTGLSAPMAFDAGTGIAADSNILAYASDSLGWLEQYRSGASDASQSKDAAASRSQDALSNTTGVNIDEEMSRLLDLEQSYKASAKMVATVNAMLASLLEAVG